MSYEILFTFVTLISSILTIIVSMILFFVLFKHIYQRHDVSLLLIMNTYISMIVFACVLLSSTVNVLQADLFGMKNLTQSELIGCQFRGFMIYETFGCFNMTFVLQGIFRLTRVIYAKHKFLQTFFFNIFFIFLQWIVAFLLLLPSYFWPGSIFSFYQNAYYCGILYEKLFGLWYTAISIYVLPIIIVSLIYARIMYFILYQTPQLAQTSQGRRARRDLIITQRILITVMILTLPGLPNVVFTLMTNINNVYSGDFFMYRIQWMGPSVTVFLFSLVLIFLTPNLKEIFQRQIFYPNSIAPIGINRQDNQSTINMTIQHH